MIGLVTLLALLVLEIVLLFVLNARHDGANLGADLRLLENRARIWEARAREAGWADPNPHPEPPAPATPPGLSHAQEDA